MMKKFVIELNDESGSTFTVEMFTDDLAKIIEMMGEDQKFRVLSEEIVELQ